VTRSGLGLILVATVSLVVLATSVLFFVYGDGQNGSVVVFTGLWAILGAVIVALRPGNAVGWLFLALGLFWSVGLATTQSVQSMSSEFLVTWVSWFSEWFWILGFTLIVTSLFLIPTGRLPSRRWLPPLVVFEVAAISCVVVASLEGTVQASSNAPLVTNPVGISGLPDIESFFDPGLALIFFGGAVIGAASLVARYQSADTVERQQLKVVALSAPIAVVLVVIGGILGTSHPFLHTVIWDAGMSLIPLSVTVAILRYRLFDVDLLISRTLVYGSLTLLLGLAYAGLVLAGQAVFSSFAGGSNLAIAVSTLVVAALFLPARTRVQRFVDRRFYRRRYDARRTLEAFGSRLREHIELDGLRSDLEAVVRETMQPERVSLWLAAEARGAAPRR
jgi:hypothetical protein